MADIIQLLPESVANQIAAGEVVQRPSSVIKELMENAIDAGASEVVVLTRNAGKALIQVIDNGAGMSETDARLSFERHATSKIRTADDLFALRTMGFRGEALASIAAIAQVEMSTCLKGEELGTRLDVEGSEVKRQEAEPRRKGTSIQVKNIFFNVPARRAFLKSNAVELRHINEEFERLALAYPGIAFKLMHEQRTVQDLSAGKLARRIVDLLGASYRDQLTPCQEETSSLRIHGYVGKPESVKKTRGDQYLFANGRFIKSAYISHAISSAYAGLIDEKNYPFYALFMEIDPRQIDVNVHPTKTEVKFEDERAIYAIVQAAVKKALGLNQISASIDFENDINLISKASSPERYARTTYLKEDFESSFAPTARSSATGWEALFAPAAPQEKTIWKDSVANSKDDRWEYGVSRPTVQFHRQYIVREAQEGLIIIDQQAAHERILYEQYLAAMQRAGGESQQSLFPKTVEFSPTDFALLLELEPELRALGFRFEVFGKSAALVSGAPASAPMGKEKEMLEAALEQYKNSRSLGLEARREKLAWSLAKKAAIQCGQALAREEIDALLQALFSRKVVNLSSQGKPIFVVLEISEINGLFSR